MCPNLIRASRNGQHPNLLLLRVPLKGYSGRWPEFRRFCRVFASAPNEITAGLVRDPEERRGMKRNPGEWLRDRLLDRIVDVALLGTLGTGWLVGAGLALWTTRGPSQWVPEWMVWSMLLLPGAGFLLAALYKAKRGWRLTNMKKGARAEETIGQAIKYALTRDTCAVAHHVEEIARVGDIDHLVATPNGLWVIETKHGRVPRSEFAETLRRIAANVEGVREWTPGTRVTGSLVFAREPQKRPKSTYSHGNETIRTFANPRALMRELRNEARRSGDSLELARQVWKLGKLETDDKSAPVA